MNVWFHQVTNGSTIDSNSVTFFGSMTGRKRGAITFNSGNNSMQLIPNSPFKYGELVSTTLDSGIKTGTGIPIVPFVWSFTTMARTSAAVLTKVSTVSVGNGPVSPAVGDFDNDGDVDIAVTNDAGQSVSIVMNNGNGSFTKQTADIPTGSNRRLVVGDFDNDGDLDIAAGVGNLTCIKILTNDGNGLFTVSSVINVPSWNHDLTTADYNGDGYLDLAISNYTANTITVLLNNKSGGFVVSSNIPAGSGVYCITSGDFDNDGFIDIAAPNYNNNNVSIYKNNGTGTFTMLSSSSVGASPQGITTGDIDGDGDLDLSITNYSSNSISVLKNNGSGTFTLSSTLATGVTPWGILFVDIDGDGDLDIAGCSGNGNSIYKNNGTGTFTSFPSPSFAGSPYISAADFNNDGIIDIAAVNTALNSLEVYYNLSSPVLISPVNNSTGNLNSLIFSWNKTLGASNYRLQVATDSLFTNIVINDSTMLGTDSVKSVSGLSALTWYYWRMNSKSINGTSLWSDIWKFKTQGTPTQVTLLQPANNAVNQPINITFKWGKAVDQTASIQNSKLRVKNEGLNNGPNAVSNYWFEYGTDPTLATVLGRDSSLTDTTKILAGLNNLTQYYWRVKAKNQTGWSSFSSIWNFTTIVASPGAPTLLSPLNNATSQPLALSLLWNKIGTATLYHVQLSTDPGFGSFVVNDSTLTDTSKALTNLNTLTNYYWRVRSFNVSGWSSFSSSWTFKTIGTASQVVLSSPANNATGQPTTLTFKWFKAVDLTLLTAKQNNNKEGVTSDEPLTVSNYWFEMATDTSFINIIARDTVLTDTTKSVSGLNTGTNYYWRVKAKNQIGWGEFCSKWQFTTLLPTLFLNLKVYLEGFWNGTTQVSDTVTVYLANSTTFALTDTAKVVLSTTGTASMNFNRVTTGSYFIVVNHRNHLETWSKLPQSFVGGTPLSYDFTTAMTQAYGDNMKQVGSVWVLFGGDANADGSIDANDIGIFIGEFGSLGYLRSDFNGDEDVNASDVTIIANNFGLIKITPGVEPLVPEIRKNLKMQLDNSLKSGKDIKTIVNEGKKVNTEKNKVNTDKVNTDKTKTGKK
jgi:hypothetical protein